MTKGFEGFGIGLSGSLDTFDYPKYAKMADERGLTRFWIAESYHARGAMVLATAAVLATRRIKVGVGIVSPYTTHPALLAMEAATLQDLSHGRFILGFGVAKTALTKHDLSGKPYLLMKEAHDIARGILCGENLTYEGKIFRLPPPGSKLAFNPPSKVPIYLGPTGPLLLRLSGRLYDGLLLTYVVSPSYLKYAMEQMKKGATESGRDPEKLAVEAYFLISIGEDFDAASEAAKDFLVNYIPRAHPLHMEHAGVEEHELNSVKEALAKGDTKEAKIRMSDKLLRKLVIVGSEEECIRRLGEYQGTGLKIPVAYHILGPDREKAIELLSGYVAPALTRA